MFVIHAFGVNAWILYGIFVGDYIICIFNGITDVLVLYCIAKYYWIYVHDTSTQGFIEESSNDDGTVQSEYDLHSVSTAT